MQRLAVAALVLAACGTSDDQRPRNLDYITEAILAPNCGAAVCHSSFRQEDGFVFDTVDAARATFQSDPELIGFQEGDPEKTPGLVLNLTIEQVGAPRMPYNAPIPDADVELIADWLKHGAPGVCNGVRACLGNYTIRCHDETTRDDPRTVEKGAYDLTDLVDSNNCGSRGKTCVNGDCL
jgi:hypothetical protein